MESWAICPHLKATQMVRGGLKDFATQKKQQENKKNYQRKTTYMKCRTKTQARETTKTRKHIQQNTHKKHQKNKKQTQTKSWKNTRVPLELAKSEPDYLEVNFHQQMKILGHKPNVSMPNSRQHGPTLRRRVRPSRHLTSPVQPEPVPPPAKTPPVTPPVTPSNQPTSPPKCESFTYPGCLQNPL